MDYQNLLEKTAIIITNLNSLNKNISKIKKKIVYINNIYSKLQNNKLLKFDNLNNTNLLFQCSILKNEQHYYQNMYSLILKHYSDEIYELSEYIVLILLSLNKLDIDNVEAKNFIFSKIIQLKKINNINYGILTNIINTTINNLKLLDELLSRIPSNERTGNVLKKINIQINRFKQLRSVFSKFDDACNPTGPIIKGDDYKPLLQSLKKLDKNLFWLIPVIQNKQKMYDLDLDEVEEFSDVVNSSLAATRIAEHAVTNIYKNNEIPDQQNKYKTHNLKRVRRRTTCHCFSPCGPGGECFALLTPPRGSCPKWCEALFPGGK